MSDYRVWDADFGDEYTKRNRVDWRKRVPFWRDLLVALDVRSILEVGCNAGWNLTAIRSVYPHIGLHGVEVNHGAMMEAAVAGFSVDKVPVQGLSVPYPFDLVMTVGVLIHIAPADIQLAMRNIVAASSRYVLAVEYAAEVETEIEYRGQTGLLWKRPFGTMYMDMGLRLLEAGLVGKGAGFDDCTFWLMEKRA